MLIHVAQYAFVFWMLVGENDADILRLRQTEEEDKNMYVRAVCTVRCLQQQRSLTLKVTLTVTSNMTFALQQIQEQRILSPICTEEKSLTFVFTKQETQSEYININNTMRGNESVIYFIKVRSKADEYDQIYLSDDEYFELRNLTAFTTYDISAAIVYADYKYSIITKTLQCTTLQRNYMPKAVADFQISGFQADDINKRFITALFTWKLSHKICYYEILCYSATNAQSIYRTIVDMRKVDQYPHHMKSLSFASQYTVGIRAKTLRKKESDIIWHEFQTPSCTAWYGNNFKICAPLKPEILRIEETSLSIHNEFALKIMWRIPEYFPEYYIIRIFLLKEKGNLFSFVVKNKTDSYYIPTIKLDSPEIEVHLSAYTSGGNATDIIFKHLSLRTIVKLQIPYSFFRNNFIALVVFLFGVMLIFLLLLLCFRQSKFKFYTNRCQYLNPQKISIPLTPNTTDRMVVHKNDRMEVNSDKVIIFEVLGEGEFGRVHRGIYNDPQIGFVEVAVKMLKDMPTSDDVTSFCHEIDMMKSVKKHPNIVGIIGHCTKDFHNMLLLTEFCCLGNLLQFLREECKNLQHNRRNMTRIYNAYNEKTDKALSNSTNEDVICKQTKKDLLGTTLDKIVGKADIPFNKESSLRDYCQNLVPISVENRDYFRYSSNRLAYKKEPITAISMLDISIQIANGMEFLSNNKVIHRDLAARNVLLTNNFTVKIGDFGLSRDIYQENIYKKRSCGKLPIKWLALESLTHQIYTTKSDTWSYGILLYEIITLGGTPYPSIDTNNLLYMLKAGYRMEKPSNCGQQLYNLMLRCWHETPADRPTFNDIITSLKGFLENKPEAQIKNLTYPILDRSSTIDSLDEAYLAPLEETKG